MGWHSVRGPGKAGRLVPFLLAGAWGQAQVGVTCDRPELKGREACVLRVQEAEGSGRAWCWSLRGKLARACVLEPLSPTSARLTAGPGASRGCVRVVVEDPLDGSVVGAFTVLVVPDPPRTARRERQARERLARLETSRCKRRLREARLRADQPPPAEAFSGVIAVGRGTFRPSVPGLACLVLVGLAGVSDASVLAALGQGTAGVALPASDPLAFLDRGLVKTTVWLNRLVPPCAEALLAGEAPPPCAPAYRTTVLAKAADLRSRMAALFVDPATLGAGACLPGETQAEAKQRIGLDQSDILAQYDRLTADASCLQYQIDRDGFALQVVGTALQAGGVALGAASGNGTEPAVRAALALTLSGTTIFGAGFGVQAVADVFGKISSMTLAYQGRYLKWANSQTDSLIRNCTGAAQALPPPALSLADGAGSSAPVLEDAYQDLSAGCDLARAHGIELDVCDTGTLEGLRQSSATWMELLDAGVPCIAAGESRGRQAPCATVPLADARTRTDTFATLQQFTGEAWTAAYDMFLLGNAIFAGSQGLADGAAAAAAAGDPQAAAGLTAGTTGMVALGSGLFASGYELLRLGMVARSWTAQLTVGFNAESRAQLDQAEAQARSSSTAGDAGASPDPGSSSGTLLALPPPSPDTAAPSAPGTAGVSGSSKGDAQAGPATPDPAAGALGSTAPPAANAATRIRPLRLTAWIQFGPWE